ncbi:MAG: SDR family oxidoreductase [Eubacterium sp.]|nr:SDR family oxidoreductase [Eubacterium sp.]
MKEERTKVILITGGAGGLGSEMAKELAALGHHLYLLDLPDVEAKAEELTAVLERAGGRAKFIPVDVTSETDWERTVYLIAEEAGRIDVLINNAGINIRKVVEDMVYDEWMQMMAVNTGSVFLGTKYVLPVMKEQREGLIINMSSVCGLVGHLYTPEAYTASKGAVTMFTRAIASRYASYGVRCNSIHPSTVDTPFIREQLKNPDFAAERLGEVPLGRLCTAEDVANAVKFLVADSSSFINGTSLTVDGGTTCY